MENGSDFAAVDTRRHLEALYTYTVAFCDIREQEPDFALRYHSPFDCGYRDRNLLQDPDAHISIVCGDGRGRDVGGCWRQNSDIVGCNKSSIDPIGLLRRDSHARGHRTK